MIKSNEKIWPELPEGLTLRYKKYKTIHLYWEVYAKGKRRPHGKGKTFVFDREDRVSRYAEALVHLKKMRHLPDGIWNPPEWDDILNRLGLKEVPLYVLVPSWS